MEQNAARGIVALGSVAALACGLFAWSACIDDLPPLNVHDGGAGDVVAPDVVGACGDDLIATLEDGGDAGESCDPGPAVIPGCVSCEITCPDGGVLDDAGEHCYFTLGASASYQQAVTLCGGRGAHVVTLASERESSLVDALDAGSPYWVGLFFTPAFSGYLPANPGEPGLPSPPSSCPGCYARGGALFDGAVPCISAADGGWAGSSCDDAGAVATVCEREPVGRRSYFCFPFYCSTVEATAGRKRYLYDLTERTAADAKKTCEQFPNGRLAVFDTPEEREQVVTELRNVPGAVLPMTAWIGASSADDGGTWRWDDGGAGAIPWGDGQPASVGAGRAFVRIDVNRYDSELAATDDDPNATRPSICERPWP